jgi:glucosamine kinase
MGRAEGSGSAIDPAHPDRSADIVAGVVRQAMREAGITPPLAALHVGLAGAGRPGPREEVRERLGQEGLTQRLSIGSDAEIAFHDAFHDGPGILVLAGTGSMVLGRGPDGELDRVGGWGPLLGDEGSGYAIGCHALRAVARAEDRLEPATDLRATVLSHAGVPDAARLVVWAATARRPQVARLAEAVAVAALAGDPSARAILEDAAAELARGVEVLSQRLGPWGGAVPVALVGGLVAPGRPLRSWIEAALGPRAAGLQERVVDPVRGAGGLALEALLQG